MFAFIIFFSLATPAFASISCEENPTYSVYSEYREKNGIPFVKLLINSSIPTFLKYSYVSNASNSIKDIGWKHLNSKYHVSKDSSSTIHYSVDDDSIKLYVNKPGPQHTGEWTLILTLQDGTVEVGGCLLTGEPILDEPFGTTRVSVGNPTHMDCIASSNPPPKSVSWYKLESREEDEAILLSVTNANVTDSNGIENGRLVWDSATEEDAGFYFCNVTGSRFWDSVIFEVKVKSKLAALWPFIGIIIEIVILAVTIGVYEIQRSKKRKALDVKPLGQPENDSKPAFETNKNAAPSVGNYKV